MTTRLNDPGDDRRDGLGLPSPLPPLDGRAGPARKLPAAVSAELVRSAIDTALEGADGAWDPQRRRPRWPRRLGLAAALAAVSVATGAGAVASRLIHVESLDPEPDPAEVVPARPPAAPPRAPAPAPVPAPPQLAAPPAAPERPPERARPARRKVARGIRVEAAPVRWEAEPRAIAAVPVAPAPAPAPVVVPENLPPEDLLASANALRQRRAWRDADQFYRAVAARFSGTDAAAVAEVASAGLRVQHLGDPAGALQTFRRTLADRPSGPLAEEARWGIAEAQRALGDARAEVRALGELLEHHPHSPLAPAARRRLAQLSR